MAALCALVVLQPWNTIQFSMFLSNGQKRRKGEAALRILIMY